eukprot:12789451-Alexandrium_andersonii.AAC.1
MQNEGTARGNEPPLTAAVAAVRGLTRATARRTPGRSTPEHRPPTRCRGSGRSPWAKAAAVACWGGLP